MNTTRVCGCKGIRTCLQCEKHYNIARPELMQKLRDLKPWAYCVNCQRCYPGWDPSAVLEAHDTHNYEESLPLPGVYVMQNFLNKQEGSQLMHALDTMPWTISQSGRRKQNFGPKTNFKKRILKNGAFNGFPASTRFVQERFSIVKALRSFQTIEQCSLEYDPDKGASIDPHVDDCWIWGERVVTVNCLGDAVLTLTVYRTTQDALKYNLDMVTEYSDHLITPLLSEHELQQFDGKVIRIPMPNLSLIVLYGPARYQFEHSVLREDVQERRVCLAYREFTPMYIKGESKAKADIVRENACTFW